MREKYCNYPLTTTQGEQGDPLQVVRTSFLGPRPRLLPPPSPLDLNFWNLYRFSEPVPEMNNSTLLLTAVNSSSAGRSSVVSTTFTSILAAIGIVTLVGNMLIVIAFIKTPSLRTSTNYYIVNMAVSDFLGPFFSWPLYASEGMLAPNVFISGSLAAAVCKLGMYLRAVSLVVSVLSLVLIALDRFVATVFPLKQ